MIIGSVVIRLIAKNETRLPVSHGRLLHAALLNIVRERDCELSEFMHNATINNFSVSLLKVAAPVTSFNYNIKEGTTAYWRIGVIGDRLLKLLCGLPKGLAIRVGTVNFIIDAVFKKEQQGDTISFIDTDIMEQNIAQLPSMKTLTLKFLAPTTFSGAQGDYPFPLPKIIFASLADKWNAFSETTKFNVKYVKEIAEYLLSRQWEGHSCVYNISPAHTIKSFVGTFSYDLSKLPREYQKIFLILAEFGVYTGVGRYTGQGMGRISVEYEIDKNFQS